MRIPGVVGVAETVSRKKPCILVMVAALKTELARRIPKEIEGYGVKVQASGEFRARENLL